MKDTLVICIGNEIRSDDSVALHFKKEFENLFLPFVEIISVHQLTPELAEVISKFDKIIFVDASIEEIDKPTLKKINFDFQYSNQSLNHIFTPESLIFLVKELYNKSPEFYSLSIPAINFDFGTELHPKTKENLLIAIETLKNFLT
ncbi:MAG: hydrogenase maturation protease [Ignavibacteria bacterium]|nr:hydrogenase maturation protease [Ignavibacteria bacterium]